MGKSYLTEWAKDVVLPSVTAADVLSHRSKLLLALLMSMGKKELRSRQQVGYGMATA